MQFVGSSPRSAESRAGLKLIFSLQGMNFIAGYLILITKSEEESFWLLDALVGRILPGMWTVPAAGLPRPVSAALTAAQLRRRDFIRTEWELKGREGFRVMGSS